MKTGSVLFFLLVCHFGFSQLTHNDKIKIDSLKKVIQYAKHDTIKNNALIAWDLMIYSFQPETDSILNKKIDSICRINLKRNLTENEIKAFKKQQSFSLTGSGMIAHNKSRYKDALNFYFQAVKINKEYNDELRLAANYNNIGNTYMDQGNFKASLKYHLKALKLHEKFNDESDIAMSYNNIGLIFENQGKYKEALKYAEKSLEIHLKRKDNLSAAYAYMNVGVIFKNMGKFDEAIKNFKKSLELNTEEGDPYTLAGAYGNIGTVYEAMAYQLLKEGKKQEADKLFNDARINYENALRLSDSQGDLSASAVANLNLGILYLHTKNLSRAKDYFEKCISVSEEINYHKILYQAYWQLSTLDSLSMNYKDAYFHFYKFIHLRDSIFSEENDRQMTEQKIRYEYGKKSAADSVTNAKEREINNIELARKNTEINAKRVQQYYLYGVLAMVVVFALFIFNRFRITRQQNKIIEEQKHIVEEKNKEITDSINYAKRIQSALLPSEDDLKNFFPESFILFKPKDIVSGDFYWMAKTENHFFYATADCTGHGVPGGFMSMLGSSFLNEIIVEKRISEPAEILNLLREKVIAALKQSGNPGENKDGMDIVLIRTDHAKKKLTYASANNEFYIIRNGEMHYFLPDKQPIGFYSIHQKPFSQKETDLFTGDCIYSFTDGYADQFGGQKGKKLKYKNLEKLLLDYHDHSFGKQKAELDSFIENWRGQLEQNDDICLIGVKI